MFLLLTVEYQCLVLLIVDVWIIVLYDVCPSVIEYDKRTTKHVYRTGILEQLETTKFSGTRRGRSSLLIFVSSNSDLLHPPIRV